ncbi:MAG TPA: lysophospholipid acyltransferase family protein [Vicinamibacterales bacterium]|nr:lysophospholipid acyltransferase family protein [Vicinamibacterales bacterium]
MIAALIARVAQFVCGPASVWHCDPHGPRQRIYFANHASHLDFVVLWSALPPARRRLARPVAGRDYWERSALRRFFARRVFRAVLVDRNTDPRIDRAAAAAASVEFMVGEMGQEFSLIVFPEGTRNATGAIGPFKSGLFHVARARPDVELIPVYLHNLNRILPRGESLPVPMLSRVVFGAPLERIPGETKDAFLSRARDAVLALKGES